MEVFEMVIQLGGWVAGIVGSIVTFFIGRRGRNNDTLNQLQGTIDMLVDKNNKLIEEITELRRENVELKTATSSLRAEIETIREKMK